MATIGLFCAPFCWAQPAYQSGIAHVAFRVAGLEAARTFYNRLGFEQFFEVKQGDRTTEAFLKVNDRQFIELYPRTDPSQPIGLMHVCYESTDIEALHAEYVQRGLTVSAVRKAGAGNLLMTMKDPEGQTIEYTQYMPGSRHFEDRGKHLGANRVALLLVGATSPALDPAAIRGFYLDKLGFTQINHGIPARLRMPGNSGQELDIAAGPDAKSGIEFGVADVKRAGEILAGLGLTAKGTPANNPTSLSLTDPDGAVITFVKAAFPDAAAQEYFGNWPAGMSAARHCSRAELARYARTASLDAWDHPVGRVAPRAIPAGRRTAVRRQILERTFRSPAYYILIGPTENVSL